MSAKDNYKRYGITEDDYWRMYQEQKGVCACCGEAETNVRNGRVLKMSIEHNHKTGAVRSLTCNRCNVIVGLCQENITILAKIAAYLRKHQ